MIAFLRGQVAALGEDHVIIDVNGVGYRALVPGSTRTRLPEVGKEVFLWTFLQVREDGVALFGFKDEDEYHVFLLLQSVTGIGPKLALSVLSAVTPDTFVLAVAREDLGLLTKVPGVGKKTAQRLCLELKDKVGTLPAAVGEQVAAGLAPALPAGDDYAQAGEALLSLGYSRGEVAATLEQLRRQQTDGQAVTTENLVRQALRLLVRRL
ncbi:MAG: Holliday junction branch migration protein RuvA [Symbiobacteriia bacterium]